MTSETKKPNTAAVGTSVKKDFTIFGFQFASTTNLVFHPSYQQILDQLNEKVKMLNSALRFELQNKETLEKDVNKSVKSVNELKERCSIMDQENKKLVSQNKTTHSNFYKVKNENENLFRANTKLQKDVQRLGR